MFALHERGKTRTCSVIYAIARQEATLDLSLSMSLSLRARVG